MNPTTTKLPTAGQIDAVCGEQNALIEQARVAKQPGEVGVADVIDGSRELFMHFLTTSPEYCKLFGWARESALMSAGAGPLHDLFVSNAMGMMLVVGFKVALLMQGQDEMERLFGENNATT